MAALRGFDAIAGAASVAAPFSAGDVLLSVVVPARTVVAGADLSASALDIGGTPTLTLNVGDDADVDRFLAATTLGQAGGEEEIRPATTGWYLYTQGGTVTVRVGTDAATDASGSVGLTLYTYPGVDITVAINQTLSRLGVIAEGETPRAEYANEADLAVREVHEHARYRSFAAREDMAWPVALIPVLPYIFTVILLAGFFGRAVPPRALGVPYVKEH
jgi:hypothetical protein